MTPLMWTILAVSGAVVALIWFGVWWTNPDRKNGRVARKGTAPGQGSTLIHSNYTAGEGDQGTATVTVPKDPQAYGKAMMPGRKR